MSAFMTDPSILQTSVELTWSALGSGAAIFSKMGLHAGQSGLALGFPGACTHAGVLSADRPACMVSVRSGSGVSEKSAKLASRN